MNLYYEKVFLGIFLLITTIYVNAEGLADCAYKEVDGYVIIDAHSLPLNDSWIAGTEISGYSNDGYIYWNGTNYLNNPGHGLVEVNINIQKTGVYNFFWRNKVGTGSVSSEHNDSWLKFPDASLFYAKNTAGHIVYPIGSGLTPEANGTGENGWFKLYCSGTLNWTWITRTSDDDPHYVYIRFDNPGIYKMQISARSDHHLIDRIVLFHEEASQSKAINLQTDVTECEGTTNYKTLDETGIVSLSVYPNPAVNKVAFSYNLQKSANVKLEIFNITGRKVHTIVNSFQQASIYNQKLERINNGMELHQGIYFYQFSLNNKIVKAGKIVLL